MYSFCGVRIRTTWEFEILDHRSKELTRDVVHFGSFRHPGATVWHRYWSQDADRGIFQFMFYIE